MCLPHQLQIKTREALQLVATTTGARDSLQAFTFHFNIKLHLLSFN